MNKTNRIAICYEYLLVILLMGISSFPVLFGNTYLIIAFFLSLIGFFSYNRKFDWYLLLYCILFVAIIAAQAVTSSLFSLSVFLGVFVRILYAYFTIKILQEKFIDIFLKLMYFFTVVALIIWFGVVVSNPFLNFLYKLAPHFQAVTLFPSNRDHLLIYTLDFSLDYGHYLFARNAGPFWEAGGFAIFLILAIFLTIIREKTFINKRNIIFSFAVLTTQSAGGIICLGILLLSHILLLKKLEYYVFSFPFVLLILIYSILNFSFIGDKIVDQMYDAQGASYLAHSRFISAKLNLEDFSKNPLFGYNLYEETLDTDTGNSGTTLFLRDFGIIIFVFYFYSLYKSMANYCKSYDQKPIFALILVLLLIILAIAQSLFNKPFFYALTLLLTIYPASSSYFLASADKLETTRALVK